jgi:hypothetical protein
VIVRWVLAAVQNPDAWRATLFDVIWIVYVITLLLLVVFGAISWTVSRRSRGTGPTSRHRSDVQKVCGRYSVIELQRRAAQHNRPVYTDLLTARAAGFDTCRRSAPEANPAGRLRDDGGR